ncbi:hypothetical protein PVAND_004135 [Polypedilum vanderplanki]|uniref:Uncharacterized protein n=1 Tax=Polypedilum vanderplanki TaxID=319348 RepID=A0A9J6BW73_POLVA|nr:hypothetical protein PVAND_004135 [Polypedilum vanderplanki]
MNLNKNYKIINLKLGKASSHLFLSGDKCLYRKNGSVNGKNVQYYICIGKNSISDENCKVTGKVENGVFKRIDCQKNKHYHPSHEIQADVEDTLYEIKTQVANTSTPISNVFHECTKKKPSPILRKLNFERSLAGLKAIRS